MAAGGHLAPKFVQFKKMAAGFFFSGAYLRLAQTAEPTFTRNTSKEPVCARKDQFAGNENLKNGEKWNKQAGTKLIE